MSRKKLANNLKSVSKKQSRAHEYTDGVSQTAFIKCIPRSPLSMTEKSTAGPSLKSNYLLSCLFCEKLFCNEAFCKELCCKEFS